MTVDPDRFAFAEGGVGAPRSVAGARGVPPRHGANAAGSERVGLNLVLRQRA